MYFARWCRRLNARRYVRNRLLNNFLRRLLTSSVHFSSPQKAIWLFGDPLGTAPSKRQKAQKPHSCAVFLLLKCFIFFRVQDVFLFEKNSSLFFKIFSTRGPTGFFDSLKHRQICACVFHRMVVCFKSRPYAQRHSAWRPVFPPCAGRAFSLPCNPKAFPHGPAAWCTNRS